MPYAIKHAQDPGGCCTMLPCCGSKESVSEEDGAPRKKLKKRVKRSCRDLCCLFMFTLYWIVMLSIATVSARAHTATPCLTPRGGLRYDWSSP